MRRRHVLSSMLGGATVAALGFPAAAMARPGVNVTDLTGDDIGSIRSLVRKYFQHRADFITHASRNVTLHEWDGLVTSRFRQRIDADADPLLLARDLAVRAHGGYANANVDVAVDVVPVNSSECLARVSEMTTLSFAGPHPADMPATRYRIDHEVHVVKAAPNRWVLASTDFRQRGSLPPLTQPGAPVSTQRSTVPGTGAARTATPASTVKDMGEIGSWRRAYSPLGATVGGYSRQAMQTYARLWAMRRSPYYPSFDDAGGDCTNFVSQCVREGGWELVGPPGSANLAKWFYGDTVGLCSWTWGGADPWFSFASFYSGRTRILSNVYYMMYGDVLQYDFTNDGSIDHTQIASGFFYNEKTVEFYMSQHDVDYMDRPLTEILLSVRASNPDVQLYPHNHINS